MPGFVATERMAIELGDFGFDASQGLPVENPGRVCAGTRARTCRRQGL